MYLQKHKLLIVDDSLFISRHLKEVLRLTKVKPQIKEVRSFTEVARTLDENQAGIILLAIPSIQSTELDLLAILKELYPGIDIVVLLATPDEEYLERAGKIGSGYYIKHVQEIERIREIVDLISASS